MGNIFCKPTDSQKSDQNLTMFGPWTTDFHHGSSTTVTPDVTDHEIWFPFSNKKLDKIRDKKQNDNYNNKSDEASNGEPLLHASAPEGHIAANSVKPHPGLYQTQSHLALKKLTNQDQNMNYNKNFKKNKKDKKNNKNDKNNKVNKTKHFNLNFNVDMLNMEDNKQFFSSTQPSHSSHWNQKQELWQDQGTTTRN